MSAAPLRAPAPRPTAARPSAPVATPGAALDSARASYLAAGVAAALVFALYLVTLAPSTAMWDASEYIAAAYVLGIPHPPGNPFFVLLGNVFTHLPIAPTVAQRVNVLAALASALSAGAWYLVAERVLARWLPRGWRRHAGAGLAALLSATAFTVWNQSVVNEKVYTVSLLFFALVSWLMVLWADDPATPQADRLLVLVAYLLGLGYANHPAGFLVAPAVGVAVLARRWTTIFRWRLLLAAAAALALGLTPFAVEPIRAAHFPAINEGEPTACTTEIGFACTFDPVTYRRLADHVNRVQYGEHPIAERQAPFAAQLQMWWLYFRWQWLRDAHNEHPFWQNVLGAVFLALGLVGGYVHWKRDRRSFWFFGPLVVSVTLALVYYMNFKYGWSQAPELGGTVPREVRDRDYFYIWSFSTWGVWVALGIVWLWERAAAALGGSSSGGRPLGGPGGGRPRSARAWLLAAPVLALGAVPLVGNWRQASRAGETATADFARDLLNSVEPYGVLVTFGDNDSFPLWYAQEVEGVRRDVTIAVATLLNTDWHARQVLVRRPVHPYDAARGPAVYRDAAWARPAGPPLATTIAEVDAVPPFVELAGPQRFAAGALRAVVDPARLQFGVLERADVFVLQLIQAGAAGGRPVFFSSTTGDYPERLGLGGHLLTQGLARKVVYPPITAGRDTVALDQFETIDLARSAALWEAFAAPSAIVRRGDWIDRPSAGIPYAYVRTGSLLAAALQERGERARAADVRATVAAMARVLRRDDTSAGVAAPPPSADVPAGQSAPTQP